MSADPDIQYGPLAPDLAPPGLVIDLVARVILAVVSSVAIWVPFRLLCRNGELAASLLALNVIVTNVITIVQALLWPDDAALDGYRGQGWCDLQVYITLPIRTMYATCFFAVIQNLATQVSLRRATGLSRAERSRKNLIQSLIIFPVPVMQIALTYLVQNFRYSITPLQGCEAGFDPNLLSFFLFLLPIPVFAVGASIYAIFTHFQFRKLSKSISLIQTTNSGAAARSNRAKRKLYLMTVCIVAPYLPMQLAFLITNLKSSPGWFNLYSWKAVRNAPLRDLIVRIPSWEANWVAVRICYIAILTAIPIFIFFGTTKDAMNTWRKYCLVLGLGKIFPRLKEEYNPDRPRAGDNSNSLQSWGNDTIQSATDRKHSTAMDVRKTSSNPDNLEEVQLPDINSVGTNPSSAVTPLQPTHQQSCEGSIDSTECKRGRRPFSLKMTPIPIPLIVRRSQRTKRLAAHVDTSPGQLDSSDAHRSSPSPGGGSRQVSDCLEIPGRWEHSPSGSMVETRVWSDDLGRGRAASRDGAARTASPHEVVVKTHIATCSTSAASSQ